MTDFDLPFGKAALDLKLISREQLNECLALCDSVAKLGVRCSLQEILLRKGYVTNQGVRAVLTSLVSEGVHPRG